MLKLARLALVEVTAVEQSSTWRHHVVLLVFERVLISLELTLLFFAAHNVSEFNELFR